jgi:hypothetical protein
MAIEKYDGGLPLLIDKYQFINAARNGVPEFVRPVTVEGLGVKNLSGTQEVVEITKECLAALCSDNVMLAPHEWVLIPNKVIIEAVKNIPAGTIRSVKKLISNPLMPKGFVLGVAVNTIKPSGEQIPSTDKTTILEANSARFLNGLPYMLDIYPQNIIYQTVHGVPISAPLDQQPTHSADINPVKLTYITDIDPRIGREVAYGTVNIIRTRSRGN